jgi:hypothetical protein
LFLSSYSFIFCFVAGSQVDEVPSEIGDDVVDDDIEDDIADDTEPVLALSTEDAGAVSDDGGHDETYGQDDDFEDPDEDDYADDTFIEQSQSPRKDTAGAAMSPRAPGPGCAPQSPRAVTFNDSRVSNLNESSLNISRAGLSLDASSFAELNSLEQSVVARQEHVVDLNQQLAAKRKEFARLQKKRAKVEEKNTIQAEEQQLQKQVEEMERLIALEKEQIAAIVDGPPAVDDEGIPDESMSEAHPSSGEGTANANASEGTSASEPQQQSQPGDLTADGEDSFASVSGEHKEAVPSESDAQKVCAFCFLLTLPVQPSIPATITVTTTSMPSLFSAYHH